MRLHSLYSLAVRLMCARAFHPRRRVEDDTGTREKSELVVDPTDGRPALVCTYATRTLFRPGFRRVSYRSRVNDAADAARSKISNIKDSLSTLESCVQIIKEKSHNLLH